MALKRKRMEVEPEVLLSVDVRYAEDIDTDNMGPGGQRRTYQVFGSVRPDSEFVTSEAEGLPNPLWNQNYFSRLSNLASWEHLHLEVLRTGSKSDPGTSSGLVVIGMARVPLPKAVGRKITGRFGLVRPVATGFESAGYLILDIEMTITKTM